MRRLSFFLVGLSLSSSISGAGCLSQPTAIETEGGASADAGPAAPSGEAGNPADDTTDQDAPMQFVTYLDDLASHPGCTTDGLGTRSAADGTPAGYTPAVVNGGAYKCAAKEYPVPAHEDTSKPIVVLVHGNSSTPCDWETFSGDSNKTPMISETLVADGFHVYASDVRYDKVPTDTKNNPSKNYDHGWAVPIVESLLTNLFEQYPAPRMFNIGGFSIGPTVIRDALRRMLRNGQNPFARIHALYYASGANHGVSTYTTLCGSETAPLNGTLAGLAACQLGNRTSYALTPFETPLNGKSDDTSYDAPCADGQTAYGQAGVCGGNRVSYTTIVFGDPASGPLLDEFVSQASSHLNGATNLTVNQEQPDKYFFNGLFPHHFGSIRSAQGVAYARHYLEAQ